MILRFPPVSGLFDHEIGVGRSPNPRSRVTVDYVGYLEDGTVLERGNAVQINLEEVVTELAEGMYTMREAGRRRIVVTAPEEMCEKGKESGVGTDSNIVFDVTLLTVDD